MSQLKLETPMEQLIEAVHNEKQRHVLERLLPTSGEDAIYLSDYDMLTNKITLLGTYNPSKKKRELYHISLRPSSVADGTALICTCPYYKFNHGKHQAVCKHVAFLVCKVAKHYDPVFFNTHPKMLPASIVKRLEERLMSTELWSSGSGLCRKLQKLNIQSFTHSSKLCEDSCPICYEDFDVKGKSKDGIVSCPRCENYVHRTCVRVWLEQHDTCVYCRSDVWRHFETVMNGETVTLAL